MGFISIGFSKVLLFFALLLCPFIHILLKRGFYGKLSKTVIGHFIPFFLAVFSFKVLQPYDWVDWEGLFNWLGIFELLYVMVYTTLSFLLIYGFTETSRTLKERLFAYKFIGLYFILFITIYRFNLDFVNITQGQRILSYSLASIFGFGSFMILGIDLALEFYKNRRDKNKH